MGRGRAIIIRWGEAPRPAAKLAHLGFAAAATAPPALPPCVGVVALAVVAVVSSCLLVARGVIGCGVGRIVVAVVGAAWVCAEDLGGVVGSSSLTADPCRKGGNDGEKDDER